jgi:Protein of unknown function (DUF2442)
MSISIGRMPELSTRVLDVNFDDDQVWFKLEDGRTLGVPLVWFPRLDKATPEQRSRWQLIPGSDAVHWPEIDEDLSVSGLLGLPD